MNAVSRRALAAAAIAATVVFAGPVPLIRATGTPCDSMPYAPSPPAAPGSPYIVGSIVSGASSDGIEGATVRLYRCDDLTVTLVTSTTTNGQGAYGFTGLAGPKWYFVQAMLTGPLKNMTPSQGTANPSALIDVGVGATGVVLSFR